MNSRNPNKKEDLQTIVDYVVARLQEFTDEQLDKLALRAEQEILDREYRGL